MTSERRVKLRDALENAMERGAYDRTIVEALIAILDDLGTIQKQLAKRA